MRCHFLIGLTILLGSCRNDPASPPPGAMTRDRFVRAYVALLEARGARTVLTGDTLATKRTADSVLARLGATREQYERTAAWYSMDVQRWRGCMEEVTRVLDERQQARGRRL
jgi:hypothetical protein